MPRPRRPARSRHLLPFPAKLENALAAPPEVSMQQRPWQPCRRPPPTPSRAATRAKSRAAPELRVISQDVQHSRSKKKSKGGYGRTAARGVSSCLLPVVFRTSFAAFGNATIGEEHRNTIRDECIWWLVKGGGGVVMRRFHGAKKKPIS
ncbi:hypothetical protein LZ31DRAFT_198635 [Colletotrichum somersetense]|nr:hypothetical protein LZ31DRAFT_198635 [Colletotrichum somersetense]